MASARKSSPRARWSAWAVFLAAWLAVVVMALAITVAGMQLAGGPLAFQRWLTALTPYALIWRLAIYLGGGSLYIAHWRPRLRAMQQTQADGGEAARARLVRIERILLIALVAIEAANLPDLVAWVRG